MRGKGTNPEKIGNIMFRNITFGNITLIFGSNRDFYIREYYVWDYFVWDNYVAPIFGIFGLTFEL